MATKKKLLQAAAGTAAASGGAGALNVEDVFSTYLYEGNGSTQVIENGINLGQSNSGGGAYFTGADTNCVIVPPSSDFGFGTGDYTIEFFVFKTSDKNYNTYYDQRTSTQNATTASPFIYSDSGGTLYFYVEGTNRIIGSGTNVATGAWTHVAVCRSSGSTRMFVNGTQIGSTFSDSINYVTPANNFSFGGSEEQSLYNVEGYMSNVRVVKGSALYTSNFTAPTSALTAVSGTVLLALQGDDPFTDNSSSGHALVNDNAKASSFGPFDAADAGEGGLVWTKGRNIALYNALTDTERGGQYALYSNTTDAQVDRGSDFITSFNSNGYSIGADGLINDTYNYASWTFRKAPKFFDVVTYTGNGTAGRTISHNLGSVPAVIICKNLTDPENWQVYHKDVGNNQRLLLNQAVAAGSAPTHWNNTTPTSTEFTVGTHNGTNGSGDAMVAYLFAHNDGDGEFGPDADQDVIKAGSFTKTDTGGTNFIEVNLGFEVQWLLVKATSESGNWEIWDVQRGLSYNGAQLLNANLNSAESSYPTVIRPTPNGFEYNDNNAVSYIYIAIRRGPMAVPTDATDVFAVDNGDSSSVPAWSSGFSVDLGIERSTSTDDWRISSRLSGETFMYTNQTSAEVSNQYRKFDYMDGWFSSAKSSSNYSWMWKRAPSFCDVVAYTGNGTAGRTVSHNLGVAPEMMWLKPRSTGEWVVYHKDLGATHRLHLDKTNASAAYSGFFNDTAPTDSVFTLGSDTGINGSGSTYIAYLFASLDGVSKVGSYTGTGAAGNQIDCGFSSGARFVLIKRSSGSQNWYVFDTERGIVAGNDPSLNLNDTSAEYSSFDYIDPYSSGFELASGNISTNASGETYIFYAIA